MSAHEVANTLSVAFGAAVVEHGGGVAYEPAKADLEQCFLPVFDRWFDHISQISIDKKIKIDNGKKKSHTKWFETTGESPRRGKFVDKLTRSGELIRTRDTQAGRGLTHTTDVTAYGRRTRHALGTEHARFGRLLSILTRFVGLVQSQHSKVVRLFENFVIVANELRREHASGRHRVDGLHLDECMPTLYAEKALANC